MRRAPVTPRPLPAPDLGARVMARGRAARPHATLAEREARARDAIAGRLRRDSIDALTVRAERGRALLAEAADRRLERRAAVIREEQESARRRAHLEPVHARLVAVARADLVAAIHETSDTFDWETP